jgi:hypothetical protein
MVLGICRRIKSKLDVSQNKIWWLDEAYMGINPAVASR